MLSEDVSAQLRIHSLKIHLVTMVMLSMNWMVPGQSICAATTLTTATRILPSASSLPPLPPVSGPLPLALQTVSIPSLSYISFFLTLPSLPDLAYLTIALPVVFIIIFIGVLIGAVTLVLFKFNTMCHCATRRYGQQDSIDLEKHPSAALSNGTMEIEPVPVTLTDIDMTCTSGSGSGLPFLVPRTIARSITLGEAIGNGRFGQVYRGMYQGEMYAVKKFFSRDEQSWFREGEIYNSVNLRHENILTCFATDILSNNGVTELWLITQFHPNGSLFDVLNLEVLSLKTAMNFALSSSRGIAYLHTELSGMQGKPSIAHRDIKSKNILVKNDGSCCLADFGLAIVKNSSSPHLSMMQNLRQGTKRYMAPEVLAETINANNFESFLRTDMYAFGLVMWEIFRRCAMEG